jgi:hypothetical protein
MNPAKDFYFSNDIMYTELNNGRYYRTCREATGANYYPEKRSALIPALIVTFSIILMLWVAAIAVAAVHYEPTPRTTTTHRVVCDSPPTFRVASLPAKCARYD